MENFKSINRYLSIEPMKKSIILFSLILLAASCNMNSPEMIKQQISRKKTQAKKINAQIAELESRIVSDSTDTGFILPVSLKNIEPEPFEHFIEVTGKLEAEEDAFISPEMNGQIKKIHVREGQAVKEGQLLISLNTSMVESSVREVESGLELATKLYERQKELWDRKIGSEMQFLEAKNARESAEARLASLNAQLDMARIRAPFEGVVETILLKEGELAAPGMQVIQLVSLDKLKLYGDISERYLMSVHAGDEVRVLFPDFPGLSLDAPIHRVGNVIDDKSRTFRIEIKIDNSTHRFKPNMYSVMRVRDFVSDSAFVVPSVILKQDINGNYLYVANTENGQLKAHKKYVTTRMSYNELSMISEGLQQGERVILKGFDQVSDGVDITGI